MLWVLSLVCFLILSFANAGLAQSQHFLPPLDDVLRSCEVRFLQPPPTLPPIDVVLPQGFYDQNLYSTSAKPTRYRSAGDVQQFWVGPAAFYSSWCSQH
jgi:hypothetical protein